MYFSIFSVFLVWFYVHQCLPVTKDINRVDRSTVTKELPEGLNEIAGTHDHDNVDFSYFDCNHFQTVFTCKGKADDKLETRSNVDFKDSSSNFSFSGKLDRKNLHLWLQHYCTFSSFGNGKLVYKEIPHSMLKDCDWHYKTILKPEYSKDFYHIAIQDGSFKWHMWLKLGEMKMGRQRAVTEALELLPNSNGEMLDICVSARGFRDAEPDIYRVARYLGVSERLFKAHEKLLDGLYEKRTEYINHDPSYMNISNFMRGPEYIIEFLYQELGIRIKKVLERDMSAADAKFDKMKELEGYIYLLRERFKNEEMLDRLENMVMSNFG